MGMLNAYGLTNAGVEACAPDIRRACDQGFKIIPNLYPEFIKGTELAIQDTLEALEIYRQILGPHFRALELNFSCPNSEEAIAQNVAQGAPVHPGGEGKISRPVSSSPKSVSATPTSLPRNWKTWGRAPSTPSTPSPMRLFIPSNVPPCGGWEAGASPGARPSPRPLDYNTGLRQKVSSSFDHGLRRHLRGDVQRYLDVGADAVSFCTLALRKPREAARIVVDYNG